jgi:hypothetical protein
MPLYTPLIGLPFRRHTRIRVDGESICVTKNGSGMTATCQKRIRTYEVSLFEELHTTGRMLVFVE